MNKAVALIVLVVTCFALILGAVIHAMNSQSAVPVPTPMPSTEPTKPQPTPKPQPEPEPSPTLKKYVVVPDDYANISDAVNYAAEGATIYVKSGTYEGPINQTIVINKTLTIVGESRESTIIKLYPAYNTSWILTAQFFSYTDAISITADDCQLRDLTVMISNPGGYISATGNRIQIVDCDIKTGCTTGVSVQGSYCKITDNSMGGFVQINGTFNEVARNNLFSTYTLGSFNLIKENTCRFLWVSNSTENVFLGNNVWSDSRDYSGIDSTWSSNNYFYQNRISGFSSGIRLWFSSDNIIVGNVFTDLLHASISLGGSSNNKIYFNNFADNTFEFTPYVYDDYTDPNYRDAFPNMTASINFWDDGVSGNYWSNYNGSDANGDGIGDSPYTIKQVVYNRDHTESEFVCGQDNFPLMSRVDIDSISIELPQWVSNLPEPQTVQSQISETVTQAAESAVPSLNSYSELQEPQQPLLSIVMSVAAAVTIVAFVACASLLLYRRKRRREAKQG